MSNMGNLGEVFWSLLSPWQFMMTTLYYLPESVRRVLRTGDTTTFFSWSRFQNVWFSAFWAWAGANIREGNGPRITALLEGRVTQARVVDDPVALPVSGVVLDIGPGMGFWVDLFSRVDGSKLRVYGVEPNVEAHPHLLRQIRCAGLEGTYEILGTGIESLSLSGIEKGSVDCVVSFLCLCSIPEPEKNIAELYQYLKRGGRWYLYEHVQVKRPWPMKLYQATLNIFWPHALGGCQLCRDTEKSLREAGPWEKIDLAQPPEEPWHQTVPHIFGTLTK